MFAKFCDNIEIKSRYTKLGIKSLLAWQNEALSKIADNDESLIFSAPTSAGKTLVAELVIQKAVLKRNEKCLFIVPMIATGEEKLAHFKNLFERLPQGVRVEGYLGARHSNGGLKTADIAVCTIEKANQLVNRLIKEDRLSELGLVVVDEIHMLGDKSRGYILELLLTKLHSYNKSLESRNDKTLNCTDLDFSQLLNDPDQEKLLFPIQFLGMSATCPNADKLAVWLGAKYYSTKVRPVKLKEQLFQEKTLQVFGTDKKQACKIEKHSMHKDSKLGHTAALILQGLSLNENGNILVFRENRSGCIGLAQHLATALDESLTFDRELNSKIVPKLTNFPELQEVVKYGVAFHTASLSGEERELVEAGFKSGAIRVIVATSTLASGVNLPARRVIIRYSRNIDKTKYHQMIGRAGRYGLDENGESFLLLEGRQ